MLMRCFEAVLWADCGVRFNKISPPPMSVSEGGILKFEGLEDELSNELALKMDENADNVKMTLLFMQKHDLIWELENNDYLLPEAIKGLGSETEAAKRIRELKEYSSPS